VLTSEAADALDRFVLTHLEDVLHVCHSAPTLSAAVRLLFVRSRERKKAANDADRLRKYLARFDLDWANVKSRLVAPG
jgi:transcriptional regulatory protein RtcR